MAKAPVFQGHADVGMAIGALSRATGVNVETIRYYERIGLVPHPPRTASGRRVYAYEHHKQLCFIRRARELGFSLDEIRAMLTLGGGKRMTCGAVKALTMRHLADIRDRIHDLQRLEVTLAKTASKCRGSTVPECPILDDLMK
jgi:MerR family mercuric resistance operon transcriptional regulator